jgi:hypothetical protein
MPIATVHKIAATIALIFLTLWLLIGSFLSSPYFGQATQKQGTQKLDERADPNEPWLTKDAAGFFTFLLVIVGSFQAGLFYVQWQANREQIRHNRLTERAYLWPGFASHLGRRFPEEGRAIWNIGLLNTGRTAGIITEIHHALVSEADYAAGRFRYARITNLGEVIPPSQPTEEIPSGVVVEVREGSRISCGYIVYTDIYRSRHEQAWKHRLHARGASEPLPRCYSDPPDKNH